ncbi:MAG TPA: acyl-CoA dehydrogenase family protein [Dehalococcoidia bacterium]|nr:acyl-CoA dehydrogenase family protein [Dehalococcoidia bacterium]
MSYFPLTEEQKKWQATAAAIAERELAPRAAETDAQSRYPTEQLDALRQAGFFGLRVSREHGGQGADLLTTALVVEELAKKCPSTAMCYKMHLEAAEVICRRPTPDQVERFVKPMARGEVFTTVAGSETWTDGDNWTSTRNFSPVRKVDGGYEIKNVRKSYVTSAGHASHFFFLCRIGDETPASSTSLLFVERDKIDARILEPWSGLGLRGNDSSPVLFNGVVPEGNRIGAEHTAMADAAPIFPPVLGVTYAAAYLGIGSGALDLAVEEGNRRFGDGSRRLDAPVNQRRIAELSTRVEAAQTLLHAVAATFDRGELTSIRPVLQAKVFCSETAAHVTQELMTMFGGTAFARRLPFERYFRDARAGLIMALPNDGAYETIGGTFLSK